MIGTIFEDLICAVNNANDFCTNRAASCLDTDRSVDANRDVLYSTHAACTNGARNVPDSDSCTSSLQQITALSYAAGEKPDFSDFSRKLFYLTMPHSSDLFVMLIWDDV